MPFYLNFKFILGLIVFTLLIICIIFFFAFFAILLLPLTLIIFFLRKKFFPYNFFNEFSFKSSPSHRNKYKSTFEENNEDFIEINYETKNEKDI